MRRILLVPIWCRELSSRDLFLLALSAWGGQTLCVPLLMTLQEAVCPAMDETFSLWSAVLISEILAIGVLLAGWRYLRPGKWPDWRLPGRAEWKQILLCLGITLIGSGVLGSFWQAALDICGIPYEKEQEVSVMFRSCGWYGRVLIFFTAVVVVPFFEELLFRRTIFAFFSRWGNIPSIIITSLIFGAVHFFLLGFPSLCWIGLVFQIFYLRSRNILVSTAAHGLLNCCALSAALLQTIFPNLA